MTVTPKAKERLEAVLEAGEYLQIGLKGGGCGGATIELLRMASKNIGESNTGEITTGKDNIKFADTTSAQYLTAGTLDYVEDMLTATFTFKPPLGIESCGCGSSIRID